MKKFLSILTISLLSAIFVGATIEPPTAEAIEFDFFDDLLQDADEGISFTEFTPGEELTLSDDGLNPSLTTEDNLRDFIVRVVNFALGFLGLIAVVIVIYGGFLYVTAAGQEDRTQTGRKAILYATIGLLIIIGSFAFVNTIIGGASGEEGSDGVVGSSGNVGASFNAAASEVQTIAREIYSEFVFFVEASEDLRTIQDEALSPSLDYASSTVPRSNMINYLLSVKQRLRTIQSQLPQFSRGYIQINEYIRGVDADIAEIQNISLNQTYFSRGGQFVFLDNVGPTLTPCDWPCAGGTGVRYSQSLVRKWNVTRNSIAGVTTPQAGTTVQSNLNPIMETLKQNYIEELEGHFDDLQEIYSQLSGIRAAQDGTTIGDLFYTAMYCYGVDIRTSAYSNVCPNQFIDYIEQWQIRQPAVETEAAAQALFSALKAQIDFSNEVSNLRAVDARLRANVRAGNAPLVVTFDVVDTIDPAGGTIIPQNVVWDLEGQQTFDGEVVRDQTLEGFTITDDVVDCDQSVEDLTEDQRENLFGTTFRQCTFKRPGTYVATVEVNSNDPTRYVSGKSSVIIKVNPPTTRIDLDLTLANGNQETVIDYYEDIGVVREDRDYVPVTLQEAEGVRFDASQTENVEEFRWTFGNISQATGPTPDPVEFPEGQHKITLEVRNSLNEIDRKIFTLDVRNIAARIRVSPSDDVRINQPVTIDGSLSSSSSAQIRSYEWTLTKLSGDETPAVDLGNDPTFTYEFERQGRYQINLEVTSSLEPDGTNAEPYEVTVISQNPVAAFSYSTPQENQPATLRFDPSASFDPDGNRSDLAYEWSIESIDNPSATYQWVNGTPGAEVITEKTPRIKFSEEGDYEVTLKVIDTNTVGQGIDVEFDEVTKTVAIDNTLDIDWANDEVTEQLDENGEAVINFSFESSQAIAYEIDFGDGQQSVGQMSGFATVPHTYDQAGQYLVNVTVFDEDDNDNSISRRIFIGGGDNPIAQARLFVNGVEYFDLQEPIEVSKNDVLTFDASESKNSDGTGRLLNYSWNFGDTDRSSSRSATHSYSELSPDDPGYFTVTLEIFDENDTSKRSTDELFIKVTNKPPTLTSIQATPEVTVPDLITPVVVDLRVFGAEDEDGQVTQYKWWYYDIDDPDERLGILITQTPAAKIRIGTNGREGFERTYAFGVEITDNDNLTASSQDILNQEQVPTVDVTNGPNDAPVAKINLDTSSVFVGDTVTFTSASTDSDGEIEKYIWDFEGDGFFNNIPTDRAAVEHVYTKANKQGYNVRLKVIDDKGGEATSAPVKVFVDTLAEPPTAAFRFQVINGSGGKKIQFTNNSKADTEAGAEIIAYQWDFDTNSTLESADSDGDGQKDNDSDSRAKDPQRLYTQFGSYNVKLTVTDNQGNTDSVTQQVKIPLADPPTAAFTYTFENGEVVFSNNSRADTSKGANITRFEWDFDTINTDTDGDGSANNDVDSATKNPEHRYAEPGTYKVRLTVFDNQGSSDDVINDVVVNFNNQDPTGTAGDLRAVLESNPAPSEDGIIYLTGEEGTVVFNFAKSEGSIAEYIFDKNIHFDTNGNGVKNDDVDFKTILPGTWQTNFLKSFGKTVVKFTVRDIYGNESFITQEIKFQ